MSFKTALMAVALAASSFAASAATLSPYEIHKESATVTGGTNFTHNFFYELAFDGPSEIGFAFTELKLRGFTDIDFSVPGGGIYLYSTDASFGNDQQVAFGVPSAGTGPADSLSWIEDLDSKYFQITVVGKALGTAANKGSYSFEIVAAPVPEAQTYALALAGVGVAGLMVRRRRQQG